MTDLTKLTAEGLLRLVIFEDDSDAVNETALRLERLEQCEAALRDIQAIDPDNYISGYMRLADENGRLVWRGKWEQALIVVKDAARAALEEPASSCHEPYKSGIKTTCHKCGAYPVEQARATTIREGATKSQQNSEGRKV